MFGLGKPRSKFGKWIDKKNIKQEEIRKLTKLSHGTITNLCNDEDYVPKISTWVKVERALKTLGHKVRHDDFFDV